MASAEPPAKGSPFFVDGECSVTNSAVVVCLRRVEQPPIELTQTQIGAVNGTLAEAASSFLNGTFGGKESMIFDCGWEVLCGQAVVVNWMRSTPEKLSTMRCKRSCSLCVFSSSQRRLTRSCCTDAGEYKLAGGNVDKGETVAEAAFRELSEEFGTVGQPIPESAVLRPFVTKQTRPIRSRSNLMQNYVCLAEENAWLRELDVDAVNADLAERRAHFETLLESGEFWELSSEEKEKVSPEVQRLDWLPLSEAVRHCLSSMVPGKDVIFVNDYQREEFATHGQKRRDPMFITAAGLIELESFPSIPSLVAWCEGASLEDLTVMRTNISWGLGGVAPDLRKVRAGRRRSSGSSRG